MDYVAAIGLAKVELIEDDGDSDYGTTTEHPRNTENLTIDHRFVETEIDTSYTTVEEALAKQNYREGEIWINEVVEQYSDTLMKRKGGSHATNLTREKVPARNRNRIIRGEIC